MEFVLVAVNLISFFAGILCIVAWYQAAIPIYRQAPAVVTRIPLTIAALVVIAGMLQGWFTQPGIVEELLSFVATTAVASFALCFLYGWLRKGSLDQAEAKTREGSFSPILYAWGIALVVVLVVTGVNSAVWEITTPFYIHVPGA